MKYVLSLIFLFFISAFIFGQEFDWVGTFGNTTNRDGSKMIIDQEKNIITAGTIDGNTAGDYLDFNQTIPITNFGTYLSKIDSSGNFIWVKYWEGLGMHPGQIKIGSDSSIYLSTALSASASDTFDIDPGVDTVLITGSSNYWDGFVIKLSKNGDYLWHYRFNGVNLITRIDLDENDNLYYSSTATDSVDCDPGPGTSFISNPVASGSSCSFICKISNSGTLIWANAYGSSSGSGARINSILVNGAQILIGGSYIGTVDFTPYNVNDTLTSDPNGTYNSDIYLLSLDTSGGFNWIKNITGPNGGTNSKILNSVALDSNSNIYLHGFFNQEIDFNPDPVLTEIIIPYGGFHYEYILKLNQNGEFVWVRTVTMDAFASPEQGQSMFIDNQGFIYHSGQSHGNIDFDFGPGQDQHNLGTSGMYISKMDTDGNYIWTIPFYGSNGLPNVACLNSVVTDDVGNVYAQGHFNLEVDFDYLGNSFIVDPNPGSYFVVKYTQDICASITLRIDSIQNVDCNNFGALYTTPLHGVPPIEFTWNGVPSAPDIIYDNSNYGMNNFTITDVNGCQDERSFIFNGPLYFSGFDLNSSFIATTFRTGFNSYVYLNGFNDGCTPVDGFLQLVFDDSLDFISSNLSPDFIAGDTLVWDFNNLTYDSSYIAHIIEFNLSPNAVIGDSVCFQVNMSPITGDIDSTNNIMHICFPVVNGYDPNDKQVYPQGDCIPHYIDPGKKLQYTVRFQNTGNANAINIHIDDVISPFLDLSTVRVVNSSHDVYTEVLSGNKLRFVFDDINLPDSASNSIESIGYIVFEIDQNNITAIDESVITNQAEIYFDFNPAVITNEVFNTVQFDTYTSSSVNISLTECDSINWNGEYYVNSGLYSYTTQNVFGCDSTIYLNLTISQPSDTTIYIEGLDSISVNGETFYSSGIYYQTINSYLGCDSSIQLIINMGYSGLEIPEKLEIQLHPNPTPGVVQLINDTGKELIGVLTDPWGRITETFSVKGNKYSVDLTSYSPGIYYIKIDVEKKIYTFKVVKF